MTRAVTLTCEFAGVFGRTLGERVGQVRKRSAGRFRAKLAG